MKTRFIGGIALVAAVLTATGESRAEINQADKAAARALFDEGRRLVQAGKHADACPKFEESKRLDPGIGTMFNLADCLEVTGKTASAWSMFLEVAAKIKAEGGAPEKEQAARNRAAALEPKLARLKVIVPDNVVVQGLTVLRDGSTMGKGSWGVAIPIDPGSHVVTAYAPGKRTSKNTIEVKEASEIVFELKPLEAGTDAATPPGPAGSATPSDAAPPPASPDKGAEPPAPPQPRGARVHDGLYMRLAAGVSVMASTTGYTNVTGSSASSGSVDAYTQKDVMATGTGADVDFALGGAVRPGFNLAGALSVSRAQNATGTVDEQSSSDTRSQKIQLGTLVYLGPMLDWYPRSTGGFHVLVSVGGAFVAGRKVSVIDANTNEDWTKNSQPIGFGFMGGLGYEWWVANQWSIGLLGKFQGMAGGDGKDDKASHVWAGGSLMANVTFN